MPASVCVPPPPMPRNRAAGRPTCRARRTSTAWPTRWRAFPGEVGDLADRDRVHAGHRADVFELGGVLRDAADADVRVAAAAGLPEQERRGERAGLRRQQHEAVRRVGRVVERRLQRGAVVGRAVTGRVVGRLRDADGVGQEDVAADVEAAAAPAAAADLQVLQGLRRDAVGDRRARRERKRHGPLLAAQHGERVADAGRHLHNLDDAAILSVAQK